MSRLTGLYFSKRRKVGQNRGRSPRPTPEHSETVPTLSDRTTLPGRFLYLRLLAKKGISSRGADLRVKKLGALCKETGQNMAYSFLDDTDLFAGEAARTSGSAQAPQMPDAPPQRPAQKATPLPEWVTAILERENLIISVSDRIEKKIAEMDSRIAVALQTIDEKATPCEQCPNARNASFATLCSVFLIGFGILYLLLRRPHPPPPPAHLPLHQALPPTLPHIITPGGWAAQPATFMPS